MKIFLRFLQIFHNARRAAQCLYLQGLATNKRPLKLKKKKKIKKNKKNFYRIPRAKLRILIKEKLEKKENKESPPRVDNRILARAANGKSPRAKSPWNARRAFWNANARRRECKPWNAPCNKQAVECAVQNRHNARRAAIRIARENPRRLAKW